MEPAEAPEMIRGSKSAMYSAFTTPTCVIPSVAPPESSSAVLPYACLVCMSDSRICVSVGETEDFGVESRRSMVLRLALMYSSTRRFVPVCEWRYSYRTNTVR